MERVVRITSGSIFSSIAGGNFWDGARQGIITSGLNHLAHSEINKLKNTTVEDSPGPPGKLEFKDLTENQLNDFRIIRENEENYKPLTTPENNEVYEVDGFYYKNFSDDKYWYKIGNGNKVTVTYEKNSYVLSSEAYHRFWGSLSYVGFKPRSEDYWYRPTKNSKNGNPFDIKNY